MDYNVECIPYREKPKVFVNADACPVKDEIQNIANQHGLEVTYVASYAHYHQSTDEKKWKFVDAEKESADLYIVNASQKGDFVVTHDMGLAASIVPKCVYVITPRGKVIQEEDLDSLLFFRYASFKARRGGEKTKGPKKFTEQDRQNFSHHFLRILSKFAGI
ncbi:YaiI/YqxD family protein [Bacillus carboniphilus]|uniref:UPF0178 protein GCM10008967_34480 n=1 Tax=Bacillus carboniphilus TaxID=86663 RepID=A0ABN0WM12_9BACI